MEYLALFWVAIFLVFGALALICLTMLLSLCFRKSKSVRRIDFFGIMAVELLAAFISLTQMCGLRLTRYAFVLLVLCNAVLAVIYLRKVSKRNREMQKNNIDTAE